MRKYKKHPTLSICMITKNEEENLAACLEGVKEFADEIIIADTGSNDKTLSIARSYGAKVYNYMWTDDFSAARNESIRHAMYDWILSIDADERVDKTNAKRIKDAINILHVDAYLIKLNNTIKQGDDSSIAGQITKSYRLFRNFREFAFTGRIHEEISVSLSEKNAKVQESNIIINHLGYVKDEKTFREKQNRNLKLLKIQFDENPDNWYASFNLGQTYMLLGIISEAKYYLMKTIESNAVPTDTLASIYNNLGECLLKEKKYDEAIACCKQSISLISNQCCGYLLLSRIYRAKNNHSEAVKTLAKILENQKKENRNGAAIDINIDPSIINFYLGHSYFEIGEFDKAIFYFRESIQLNSKDTIKAKTFIVHSFLNLEKPDEAFNEIQSMTGQGIEDETIAHLFYITGNEWARKKNYEKARKAYCKSLELNHSPKTEKIISLVDKYIELEEKL